MKKTTRLVALITCAIVFVVACAALVACTKICEDGKHVDSNHDGICDVCGTKDLAVTHLWNATTGKCTVCGLECAHEHWTAGTCDVCKKVCTHETWTTGADKSTCTVCGTECTHAAWTNGICNLCKYGCAHDWDSELGVCTICAKKCAHTFDAEGTCEICGLNDPNYSETHYPHTFVGGVCSEPTCGWECVHKDHTKYFNESVCTLCGWECENHTWEATGGTCTICGVTHKHKSSDFTTKTEESAVCSVCGWTCTHEYNDFGLCITCGYACLEHVWGANDKCEKCGMEKPTSWVNDADNYTYRVGPSELPTAWNSHNVQSATSDYVLGLTTDGLYTLDYNEDYTSFTIIPSMASDFPIDVSAQYVGQYGIKAGETGKAYKIPLKTTLKFDNGEAINANTFVRSVRNLLNPQAANYRADELYATNNLKIYGAESYAKQNSYALSAFVSEGYGDSEYVNPSDFVASSSGIMQVDGKDVVIDLTSGGNWGSNGLAAYAGAGYLAVGFVMDEATGRVKIFSTTGEWILTRSLAKVTIPGEEGEEDGEDFEFYDLEGNKLQQRYVNDEGTAWVYLDKDGEIVEGWAGCAPQFIHIDAYQQLLAAADEQGWVKLTAELVTAIQNVIAYLQGFDSVEEYAAACEEGGDFTGANGDINYALVEFEEMAFLGQDWGVYDFENVGFFADGDYALVIILVQPMEDNFYLRRALCTDFYLVYNTLYESTASTESGVYSNSYGTSVDTYVGFGPYKLVSFLADSKFRMERNPYWHGYYESKMNGLYQTTAVEYIVVKENATRLEMFLKGELDSYGLQATDMKDYISSKYTYFQESESTWYVAMNPDVATYEAMQALATPVLDNANTVIKTPMSIFEFRQALSYSLDRAAFNLEFSPTSGVAKGLLSSQIVSNPDEGEYYRSTDAAKDALLSFWGLADEWGPDKEYETRDEAIESITGYDPAGAKTLFNIAYDKAVEAGFITQAMIDSGKWEVQIMMGIPVSVEVYVDSAAFLAKNWTEAVKGTKFEGHLSFKNSQELGGTTFGTYLRNGSVDMLWLVGYSGDQFDPYGMMDVYSGKLQYDPFTDTSKIMLDIELDGKLLRASLGDWIASLQGKDIQTTVIVDGNATSEKVTINVGTNAPTEKRVTVTAKCETAVLNIGNIMPLCTDASASLRCMRIVYKTEDYVLGIGRGGLKYNTYTMTDNEFAAFVVQQGGTLNYKATD